MRHLMRLTMFGALLGAAACAAPAPPPPPAPTGPSPAEMVSAANDLDKRFVEAFNKGDVDGVMATYWNSPDVTLFPPDAMAVRGWEAIKAGMTDMLKTMAGAKLEFSDQRNAVHGNVVVGSGLWKLTIPAAGKGPATVIDGRYSDVKAQKDGKWVLVIDHASVPLPPPPGAAKGKK